MLLTKRQLYQLPVENRGGLSDFLATENILEFTGLELLHEAVTCTFPATRILSGYTRKRKEELYQKCAVLEAALSEKQNAFFGKSLEIGYLDSVEKSLISYYLGMLFTKLVGSRLFDIDYMAHSQLLHDKNGEYFFYVGRKKCSEMLGYKLGDENYSVWAAKGRSNNSLDALKEGLEQAGDVLSVQGKAPALRAVCMTYYENGIFSARVQTPSKKGTMDLQFENREFLRAYYQPIRELFLEFYNREEMQDQRIAGVDMVEVKVTIPYVLAEHAENETERCFCMGMPRSLAENGLIDFEEIPEAWKRLSAAMNEKYGDSCYFGKDFVYIRLEASGTANIDTQSCS